jgi:putative ABC transport system permease protein
MLTSYIKIALKVLARRKFFTFISLFGISLTLLVLIVGTAILDNIFSPRAPESRFDRVVGVYVLGLYSDTFGSTGNPGYRFLDEYMRGLEGAEATSIFTVTTQLAMYHEGAKIETHMRRTDGAYWNILDFDFVEGGPFTEADNENAKFVAVITTDLRGKLFGSQPALGKTLTLDGQQYRVVGVVEPVAITRLVGFSEIWAPIRTMKGRDWESRMHSGFNGIVLARNASDIPMLQQAFRNRLAGFHLDDPRLGKITKVVAGLDTQFEAFARMATGDNLGGSASLLRIILIAAALLFITLPTMNLVSVNLSRILERAPEIGVRRAFGASSRALVLQFVVENVILTVIGGAIGFVLAIGVLAALSRIDLIPYAVFDVNLRIFAYGIGLAALFGVISGVYPAWRMSRLHPVTALRGGAA